MERAAFEWKGLALIALLGYVLTFLLGTMGPMRLWSAREQCLK